VANWCYNTTRIKDRKQETEQLKQMVGESNTKEYDEL
jgi:hypothetical protein